MLVFNAPNAAKWSILIPFYNAAQTLPRTLTSLLQIEEQHRSQVQVLLIDDGSHDTGRQIARAFAANHAAFRWEIISQANRGVSAARNAGLERVAGEWITFLDADDELALDVTPLLDEAGAATCLLFAQEFRGPGDRVRRVPAPCVSRGKRADMFTGRCPCTVSSVALRRSQVDVPFADDIRYTEDWLFWNMNPRIFEQPQLHRHQPAAIVYRHDQNASRNYEAWGRDRAIAAGRILAAFERTLTAKQRNNLKLQQAIGTLQQRQSAGAAPYFLFPCDFALYCKLWAYQFAALTGLSASHYGWRRLPPARQSAP